MEYWCDHRLVVGIREGDNHREIPIDRPFALVGSHPQANVRLRSNHSPKRAMYLHALNGTVLCRQLEVSERQAHLPSESGILHVAAEKLRVRLEVKAGGRVAAQDNALWPVPVLEVRGKKSQPVTRRMSNPLQLIGRHSECELELRCRQVSLFHCVLYAQRGRLWCIDLQSGNGTLLGGQAISCSEVLLGDELTVGTFRITFQRYSKTRMPSGGSQPDLIGAAWQLLPEINAEAKTARQNVSRQGELVPSSNQGIRSEVLRTAGATSLAPSLLRENALTEANVLPGCLNANPDMQALSPVSYDQQLVHLVDEQRKMLKSLETAAESLTSELERVRILGHEDHLDRELLGRMVEQAAGENQLITEMEHGNSRLLARVYQQLVSRIAQGEGAPVHRTEVAPDDGENITVSTPRHFGDENDSSADIGNPPLDHQELFSEQAGAPVARSGGIGASAGGPRAKVVLGHDPLMHFVADRLVEIDSGRQRRLAVMWGVILLLQLFLGGSATVLFYWWLNAQPTTAP